MAVEGFYLRCPCPVPPSLLGLDACEQEVYCVDVIFSQEESQVRR